MGPEQGPETWEGQTHRHDGTEPQPEAASGDRDGEGGTGRWERRRRETLL